MAHAALLGESWRGAARGLEDVAMLTLGTGVGGAAIVDGRLLKGHLGRAGHLGHMTVDFNGPPDDVLTPGSIELEMGNKTVHARSAGRFASTRELVEAHLDGDVEATQLWTRSIRALAACIASIANVLDPEASVNALQNDPRNYTVLGFLDNKPRVTYLARIRNPNPATAQHDMAKFLWSNPT